MCIFEEKWLIATNYVNYRGNYWSDVIENYHNRLSATKNRVIYTKIMFPSHLFGI